MNAEMVRGFLDESWDNLHQLDAEIVALEQDPESRSLLSSIFRTIHTLKASAAILQFRQTRQIAHATENILALMREKQLAINSTSINAVLSGVDRIKILLTGIEAKGEEPHLDSSQLLARLGSIETQITTSQSPAESTVNSTEITTVTNRLSTQTAAEFEAVPAIAAEAVAEITAHAANDEQDEQIEYITIGGIVRHHDLEGPQAVLPETETAAITFPVSTANDVASVSIDSPQAVEEPQASPIDPLTTLGARLALVPGFGFEQELNPPEQLQQELMETISQWNGSTANQRSPETELPSEPTPSNEPPLDRIEPIPTPSIVNSESSNAEPLDENQTLPFVGHSVETSTAETTWVTTEVEQTPSLNRPRSNEATTGNPSVRVKVDLLDQLMSLVGRLADTQDQVAQLASHPAFPQLSQPVTELHQLTADLRAGLQKTRWEPLSTLFATIPRMLRDLGQQLGKTLRVECHGGEIEIDRVILDNLREPLLHLIRNAADHGIEPAPARIAAGKSAEGQILVQAEERPHATIRITVADDGSGLHLDAIRNRLMTTGQITAAEVRQMPESELIHHLFEPGFTTAESVTEISGRGVGLDVVHTVARQLGGAVSVEFTPDQGTRFTLELPRSLTQPKVEESPSEDKAPVPPIAQSRWMLADRSGRRVAISMAQVDRVEHIAIDKITSIGPGLWRAAISPQALPLVEVGPIAQPLPEAMQSVIVAQSSHGLIGLMVDSLVEVTEQACSQQGASLRPGISGTILWGNQPVDTLEIEHFASQISSQQGFDSSNQQRVLIIEDSLFFRRLLESMLRSEGYLVTPVETVAEAISQLQSAVEFCAVISDIELAGPDGCELARWIRSQPRFQSLPTLAFTSLASELHNERLRQAGFGEVHHKTVPHDVLTGLRNILTKQGEKSSSPIRRSA